MKYGKRHIEEINNVHHTTAPYMQKGLKKNEKVVNLICNLKYVMNLKWWLNEKIY